MFHETNVCQTFGSCSLACSERKIYQFGVINSTVAKSELDTVQLLGLSLMPHILKYKQNLNKETLIIILIQDS